MAEALTARPSEFVSNWDGMKGRGRDIQDVSRNQSRTRNMRPAQFGEEKDHRLHVLNLSVRDRNGLRRRDLIRWVDPEGRSRPAELIGGGELDEQRLMMSGLEGGDLDLGLYLLDPEGG